MENAVSGTAIGAADQSESPLSQRVQALQLPKDRVLGIEDGRSRGTWMRWLLAAIVLGGGSWLLVHQYREGRLDGFMTTPPEVDTAAVSGGAAQRVVLDLMGYIVVESKVQIGSKIPGAVVAVCAEEGDRVETGDLLAELDAEQYAADLRQAQAALGAAQARLAELRNGARPEEVSQARAMLRQGEARMELASREFDRAKQLKDTISPREFDLAKAQFEEAEAQVANLAATLQLIEKGPRAEQLAIAAADAEKAEAAVAKAEHFLDSTRIVAPITGTILSRTVDLGEVVRPEMLNTSLFELADLTALSVEIEIQERDLAGIRLGQPCRIVTEAYPDRQYEGRLEWLAPVFSRLRGVQRGRVRILNPDQQLFLDMNCRVSVLDSLTETAEPQLLIPAAAVLDEQGNSVVYVFRAGRAWRRSIRAGTQSQGMIDVEQGLEEGELVILPGATDLRDGQSVQLRGASMRPGQ